MDDENPSKVIEIPSLQEKMRNILEAVLKIEKAENEEEACLYALWSLESLNYPFAMISLLETIDGVRYIIADPKLSIGQKWKNVASKTKRYYDSPTDVLSLVLTRNIPRFIPDSRNDPDNECDKQLCIDLNVITQYIMPLSTDRTKIGTLQIDLGQKNEKPVDECIMFDALAAHLSVTIDRHRTLLMLDKARNDLMGKSKLIAYEVAAAKIMHSLSHEMKDYVNELKHALNNEKIRSNRDALEFLEKTFKSVGSWFKAVEDNAFTLKKNEQPAIIEPFQVIQEAVSLWYNVASAYKCHIEIINKVENILIDVRRGSMKELFSCLLINSIEANARKIEIKIDLKTIVENSYRKEYLEIIVSDDGDGIPETSKDEVFKLGWTSKSKKGHGIGMTIITLLVNEMGGYFNIISYGKSSQESNTEMQILIPRYTK